MKFSSDELHFIIQCIEGVSVKGKDSHFVSKLLNRFGSQFKKEVEKDNGDLEKDTK